MTWIELAGSNHSCSLKTQYLSSKAHLVYQWIPNLNSNDRIFFDRWA